MTLKIDSNPRLKRFPYWLRQPVRTDEGIARIKDLLGSLDIHTVCQSAQCPNIYDCFSKKKCTFLISGNLCTRNCGFCAIETGNVLRAPDKKEILNIRKVVEKLSMRYVVITSVTRDDLGDGGAGHFADCVDSLKGFDLNLKIETLVPDFLGKKSSVDTVVSAGPDVFSHNIETVPRLYKKVRPEADYERSLEVVRHAKTRRSTIITKSGLMVGLGETRDEVYCAMRDLKEAGCDVVTIGQYLRPGPDCLDAEEFLEPAEFDKFSKWAEELGFRGYSCSPFTRSSSFTF